MREVPALSIVIPTFNEAQVIGSTLLPLQAFRERGAIEIILSDGGSHDQTREIAKPLVDKIVNQVKGRSAQMNVGAGCSSGDLLLFLHADTQLPTSFFQNLPNLTERDRNTGDRFMWGFFPVRLSGEHSMLRVIEWFMNQRSRLTSVATGDQAIFVSRALWLQLQGFQNIPLMEDVEFSKRARQYASPIVQSEPLVTSSRRWEEKGVFKTMFLMWRLRWMYFRGISPEKLVSLYR